MQADEGVDQLFLLSKSTSLVVRGEGGFVHPGVNPNLNEADSKDNTSDGGGDYPSASIIPTTTVHDIATTTPYTTFVVSQTEFTSAAAATQPVNTDPTVAIAGSTSPPSESSKDSMDVDQRMTGLSRTTEYLLVAASSIAATLIVVFVVFLIYRMRKGYKISDSFRHRARRKSSRRPTAEAPPVATDWSNFKSFPMDVENIANEDDPETKTPNDLPTFPSKAYIKLGLDLPSPQPVTARKSSARSISSYAKEESVQDDVNETQPSRPRSQRRPPSGQPSSPVLPVGRPSREFFEESDLSFQSMPTYLRDAGLSSTSSPQKVSRFSWTNSQVPKTPQESRFSFATSVSSVPRYRTVESWVGVQAGRIDAAKLQQHLRQQANRKNSVPSVPDLPTKQPSRPQSKKLMRQQKRVSDKSIFKVHPGTKIKLSRESVVPSEILDALTMPHTL